MIKYVYAFEEGNKEMRNLLGGKGANLSEMINIGLPVPGGFTITTEACNEYYKDNHSINDLIKEQILEQLKLLEKNTGKKMGDKNNPLLVSVRSGARVSMPGMMDTVLNLGLNDEIVVEFANATNNPRFAYDSYRRFIQMFSDVVKGYPKSSFEHFFDEIKEKKGYQNDSELTAEDMMEIVEHYKDNYEQIAGEKFPQDPIEQLMSSIEAVFKSWMNERAVVYRKLNDISSEWGTAVNIQEMVYGNKGNDCGTGVAFTRNPSTGENVLYGEYLINAQGEDVVAGIRTPEPISKLEEDMPEVYAEFVRISKLLEKHYKDMQDMEFTIENGKLFMLQTRNGKRTAFAALKIAVDLVNEGMITKEEALLKVEPRQLDQLLHPNFDLEDLKNTKVIATGLAASPGAATGKIYFTAEDVVEANKKGINDTLLVRLETSPEDIEGMNYAKGILTIRGGMTSHAAVVARGMGKSCVCGTSSLRINQDTKELITADSSIYKEGDYISIDGSTGKVYEGQIKTVDPEISGDFKEFMSWADEVRKLKIRTNADTAKDAKEALKLGAEGIGLCRTEHMFFQADRIFAMRQMITSNTLEQREKALAKILPMQRDDFESIFRVMKELPVTIRYLDPPLHEFLPHSKEELEELARELDITYEDLKARTDDLHEFNPMMGHRGCRLSITYPEIAKMQTRAVIEAVINVKKENINVVPEIMIPLISESKEFKYIKKIVEDTAIEVMKEKGIEIKYQIGTMIEIPRAVITADKIAEDAEFFSFGTNDLTQMMYGFSRDDAAKFLHEYYTKAIFDTDPFEMLDQIGVGEMLKIAVERGKSTRPNIKLGICGEHGGEPSSVEFCHRIGLTYVSCSPYRIPIARLAAAQANLRNPR